MAEPRTLFTSALVERTLVRIAHEISERNENSREVVLVGIHRGGVHLANRLKVTLESIWQHRVPTGELDVTMHRDDLDKHPAPEMRVTSIPFDITGKVVVLVDDVLFSGRTTRAALDALNDFGRPEVVQLAVLIDRGHRQLPIRADFIGKNVPTSLQERIQVSLREDGLEDSVTIEKL
ncbi:MAG: bifunctional pyr operon transcriptional regulator/uracil phosphoribosyltransferase PyrR [Verrucomicrobiota bacterium]|nr:bifunctional pyr operon transcriptional regulator/uracil phosphoribosyltransferase PyrR [Verrucomicrobiota bacterium]